jgi:hypothetical protein
MQSTTPSLALFSVLATLVSIHQVRAEGVVQTSRGTYSFGSAPCASEGCVGNLLTCDEGTVFSFEFERMTSLANVCDDTDPANRCGGGDLNGRLTSRTEFCTLQNTGNANLTGLLINRLSRGKSRTCFDPEATSDCSDPLPARVVVIRESDVLLQERFTLLPQQQSPMENAQRSPSQVTSRVVPTTTRPFTIDGQTVELPARLLTVTKTWQADPDEDNCALMNALLGFGAGCGAASVAVAASGPSCCADCNGDGEVRINELITGVNNSLTGCSQN